MRDEAGVLREAIGEDVSRETQGLLRQHLSLLEKWNRRINLVSPSTIEKGWTRHVVDSAQVFAARDANVGRWLDFGTGGGFPGLVCAVLARELAPDLDFVFVESDRRKSAFLINAVGVLGLKARVVPERIESMKPAEANIISARAVAPLDALIDYAVPHLACGGQCIFPKGQMHEAEIAQARASWRFKLTRKPSITDPNAVILALGEIDRV